MRNGSGEGNAPLSPDTVSRWVIDYTECALQLTADLKFGGWGSSYLFNAASPIRNGHQWWAQLACCIASNYILACHVSTKWNEEVVATFVSSVTRVLGSTESPPFFHTGPSRIYRHALQGLGLSPFHFASPGLADSDGTSTTDRPKGDMMREIQRAFRMRSLERAELHLKGWALSYNHQNGQHVQKLNMLLKALEEPTVPTTVPRIDIPSWTEVVRRSALNG